MNKGLEAPVRQRHKDHDEEYKYTRRIDILKDKEDIGQSVSACWHSHEGIGTKERTMRYVLILFFLISVELQAYAAEKIIPDNEASKYVGESVAVKGVVANVFQSNKGNIFLNFGKPYPNQTFAAVIFSKDTAKFGNVKAFEGKTVEVNGMVQSYKGKAEIVLKDPGQIRLSK